MKNFNKYFNLQCFSKKFLVCLFRIVTSDQRWCLQLYFRSISPGYKPVDWNSIEHSIEKGKKIFPFPNCQGKNLFTRIAEAAIFQPGLDWNRYIWKLILLVLQSSMQYVINILYERSLLYPHFLEMIHKRFIIH